MIRRLALGFALAALSAAGAMAQQSNCRVADPSGTPLNVRDAPNGRITGTLPNGLAVRILSVDGPGQTWVRIGDGAGGQPIGWVFRRYLACSPTPVAPPAGGCRVADPSGTPLNLRDAPDGRITGTLPNGRNVRIVSDGADDPDQPWTRIADAASGQPLGWVFRRYLDCR
jgi:hypothetical protein